MSARIVPGEGDLANAKVCLVGEAPGSAEARIGKPFVGPAGDLLMRLLNNAGLTRSLVYITNVVKEQPPANNIAKFIEFKRTGAVRSQAYNEYENMLYEELDSCKANVIVPLGNVPLYALTRKTGITKWRGSILRCHRTGRKVIPTIHPAAALREYLYSHHISHDLRKVVAESEFPEVRTPARKIIIAPTFYEAMGYLDEVCRSDRVGVDIETMNEEVSCISFAVSPFSGISIPFYTSGKHYFLIEEEMQIWRKIAKILENRNITKIGQNLVFDATFLLRRFGIKMTTVEDTMVAQGIAYPDFPKGLDFITSIYTNEPYYKDEGKKWFKYHDGEENFWIYNAKDSLVCVEALPKILDVLESQSNVQTYNNQRNLIEPLVYMHERGIKVERASLDLASEEVRKQITSLESQLYELCGYELNHRSPKQLQDFFYIRKGFKPYISRKTGNITLDHIALKRLSAKGSKEASLILELRHLSKLHDTYLTVNLDNDGRLRCAFNPVGTISGRLSSSKTIFDTGMNMQNLPEEFRQFIVADDECLLVNVDLAQAENRVVAYIAPEPTMIKAFEDGTDMHRQTASLIFGKPFKEISDEPGSAPIGTGNHSERFWGKKANHSLNYDLGYRSFAVTNELPESESKFIVERFHLAYPGIRQYHAWIRFKLSKGRTLTNPFGRRRIFAGRWGDELFKDGYAWLPQSTVADKLNRDGLNFMYYNQQWFWLFDILNQVHDSLTFQFNVNKCTATQVAEALIRLKDSLESPIQWKGTSFSIPADVTIGKNLSKKSMMGVDKDEFTTVARLARRIYTICEQLGTAIKL